MRFTFYLPAIFIASAFAVPTPSSSSPAPVTTACGDIVNSCNITFLAKQAFDCLISVPFDPVVGSRLIKYYTDTLQFQTTLSYLKTPPSTYQQPAVDLIGGLEKIQQQIDDGTFRNQYEFEATLKQLVYEAHDSHLQISLGILHAFSFYSPYYFISLSADGTQLPRLYIIDDILVAQNNSSFTASPIKSVNGQDAVEFVTQFGAKNAIGNLEPNADWNDLMSSYAAYIQEDYSILEAYIEFYPGDTITLLFENGTQVSDHWGAIYHSPGPTGPLATGGDFYNFFVLGFYPASYDPDTDTPDPCAAMNGATNANPTNTTSSTTNTTSSDNTPTATSWPDTAYPPIADVFQPDLFPDGGGFVTGYFLKNISVAVLSIPTFQMSGNDTQTFSDTIGNFLTRAHEAGMTKVLIDLQQNLGGDTLLAIDTYKHFFPSNDTFRGSRLRAQPFADVIGNTATIYFDTNRSPNATVYDAVASNVWVATDRLNAVTNQNFTSWGEFFGPHPINGDTFTTVQRENISSAIFDENTLGIDIYGAARPAKSPQLYDPADIAILSDGLCASACAVFMEMMHHEAGIRNVVVGGAPQPGPMQAASGTRGAQVYSAQNIDKVIADVKFVNQSTIALLPDRTVDTFISFIGVNLRDQIRQGSNTPLQFQYDAADCRIFYTADTATDYSQLWTFASDAVWKDPNLCVPGSTGFSSVSPNPSAPSQNYKGTEYAPPSIGVISSVPNLELDSFVRSSAGKKPRTQALKVTCDNRGSGCAVGRCSYSHTDASLSVQLQPGKTIPYKSGVCPSTVSMGGGIINVFTELEEPAEIHGEGKPEH